jgi:TrbC/VIRB2 pilin
MIVVPAVAFAQAGGTPFDTGFTAIQTLFTGTIAKVASLVAIVIGGYAFAHGEPGAKNFDHGYAVTSHSSQSLTAERVLVNADTGVHPDLLNSRFGYVSVSRASHEAILFTNDASKLGSQLGSQISKTTALEISQASSISQGIGMNMS